MQNASKIEKFVTEIGKALDLTLAVVNHTTLEKICTIKIVIKFTPVFFVPLIKGAHTQVFV